MRSERPAVACRVLIVIASPVALYRSQEPLKSSPPESIDRTVQHPNNKDACRTANMRNTGSHFVLSLERTALLTKSEWLEAIPKSHTSLSHCAL